MKSLLYTKAFDQALPFVVSLDGPSGVGKSTIGKNIANNLNLKFVGSSVVYRKLAKLCIDQKVSINDINKIKELSKDSYLSNIYSEIDLGGESIGEFASQIATIAEVRENLSKILKKLIKTTPRIIMEGRDIGTVIAPNADLKIFLTASLEVRAKRRYKQLKEEGKECILSEVLGQLEKRDDRDINRSSSPLIAAKDSLIIDSSNLLPSQVIEKIISFITYNTDVIS